MLFEERYAALIFLIDKFNVNSLLSLSNPTYFTPLSLHKEKEGNLRLEFYFIFVNLFISYVWIRIAAIWTPFTHAPTVINYYLNKYICLIATWYVCKVLRKILYFLIETKMIRVDHPFIVRVKTMTIIIMLWLLLSPTGIIIIT